MARKTKRNRITDAQLISEINHENARLISDFLDYLRSTQKSDTTIAVYQNDLEIAMVWCLKYNNNCAFTDWKKRDIVSFQNWLVNTNGNSPARVRRIKATLSSLSNYIENVLDDIYPNFKNIIHKIESPVAQPVREKTVLEEEQLDKLLEQLTAKGDHEKACMLALAMCSGRRKAELVRFKTHYFDDENIVFGSLYKTPELVKTKGRGRGKYINCYTLVHKFKPYLDAWLNCRKERGIESEWLFPKHKNYDEPLEVTTLNSWANTFSRLLGVDFYWHSLRHYMTTYLSRSGIPDSVIAKLISWESLDMVELYKDISVEETLGEYFGSDGIKARAATSINDLR